MQRFKRNPAYGEAKHAFLLLVADHRHAHRGAESPDHRARGKDNPLKQLLWSAPRKEVRMFAGAMETVLRWNDHKGGWRNPTLNIEWFRNKLVEEVMELLDVLKALDANMEVEPDTILREACDVANIAMMIADNWGGSLAGPRPEPQPELISVSSTAIEKVRAAVAGGINVREAGAMIEIIREATRPELQTARYSAAHDEQAAAANAEHANAHTLHDEDPGDCADATTYGRMETGRDDYNEPCD